MNRFWTRATFWTPLATLATFFATTTKTSANIVSDYFDPNNTIIGKTALPDSPPSIIALNVISAFLEVLGLILLIIIIYAGYTILMSQGAPDKVKKGKDTIFWAIVGVIIILASLGIVTWLDSTI